jgi:hypothetical protein
MCRIVCLIVWVAGIFGIAIFVGRDVEGRTRRILIIASEGEEWEVQVVREAREAFEDGSLV